jgi:hypothetical protein
MSTYGRQSIATIGKSIKVTADGRPKMKQAGVTIDWTSVAVQSGDTTLNDGVVVLDQEKFLRYGQVLCKITGGEIATVTEGAGSSGGTFTLTVNGQTTTAIAQAATNATVQAALVALSTVGTGNVTVTGSNGGPYTVTFATSLGDVTFTGNGASLTGGTSTITIATTSQGGRTGYYGPYDPAAVDGRATLTKGEAYIVLETMKQNDPHSDHPPVLFGGTVFLSRIIQSGTATHTLAAGPTLAELLAVFPELQPVTE